MAYNHAQWLLQKLKDPKTSTTDYLRYEREYQDMELRQKMFNNEYREPVLQQVGE
jgi:hypothetical protein